MKRLALALAAFALAVGLATGVQADEDDTAPYGPGYGMGHPMGPGMMGPGMMGYGGMGPGMMGYGGMGFGGPMGLMLGQLEPEQRERLRSFHFDMHRRMIAVQADVAQARLRLAEAMHTFPLEREQALQAFQAVQQARRALFELRLTAMAQVQEIVGRELWERMHSGVGFGPGGAPGVGPGRMGPGAAPGMMGPRR